MGGGGEIAVRGDVVLVALAGDYGKPRPAVVVQDDNLAGLATVIVCPMTSALRIDLPEFRVKIPATSRNGLEFTSYVMIDKPSIVPKEKLGDGIGQLSSAEMADVSTALSVLLGLA
jgi:mRNA interferase MazF